MKRRQTLAMSAVALGAAAAGAGWAWWQQLGLRTRTKLDPGFWTLRFDQPTGGELSMSRFSGTPLVLNFWATWCPPCVKEMPLLDAFHRQHQATGWQVVGLAVDGPTPVREFLAKHPVGFPIGLAGLNGVDVSRSLGNERGALPFSVIINRSGELVFRKLGTFSATELSKLAQRIG
jgi:thiol-disulfide isomerase/thioredoxin